MVAILEIEKLNVRIPTPDGTLHVVRDLDLQVDAGQTLCLVGESGCGKTMSMMAIIGLLPSIAKRQAKAICFNNQDLTTLSRRQMEDVRGRGIGVIFQDPLTAFNPTMTIGRQLEEVHLRHFRQGRPAAREKALALLRQVGVTSPESRLAQYPHELSGGLRQRAMIAMALMCDPVLLLADEPTTALDVTIQAQVLGLLRHLQKKLNIAIVFVTHDLGVVAAIADHIAVMYAGEVVETGSVSEIFKSPNHPYTQALFSCVPTMDNTRPLGTIPGRVPSLLKHFDGCAFHSRCSQAHQTCTEHPIALTGPQPARRVRCILATQENQND